MLGGDPAWATAAHTEEVARKACNQRLSIVENRFPCPGYTGEKPAMSILYRPGGPPISSVPLAKPLGFLFISQDLVSNRDLTSNTTKYTFGV